VAGHAFISYSREDQAYVDRLVDLLRQRGADVWLDRDTGYGKRWATVVRDQVRSCAAMVVIMTPSSELSTWVEREILEAEQHDKPILPLLLSGEVWFRLRDCQAELVVDGQMPTDRYADEVVALARLSAGPQSAQPDLPARADAASSSVGIDEINRTHDVIAELLADTRTGWARWQRQNDGSLFARDSRGRPFSLHRNSNATITLTVVTPEGTEEHTGSEPIFPLLWGVAEKSADGH
jgi:hypothetical protein